MKLFIILSVLFLYSCGDDEDDCKESSYYVGNEKVTCCTYDDGDIVCW